jgi:hypothetical protein
MVTRKRVSEFKFESSSTPGKFYTVTIEGESYDCTCPGFAYRKKCSHLEKAKKQKQVEPVNEEETKPTPKNLRKNLFPDIEIDWGSPLLKGAAYDRPHSKEDYIFDFADKITDKSCRAAEALGEIGNKNAVESLIRLLNGDITGHIYGIVSEIDDEFMDFDNEMVEKSIMSAASALGEIGDEQAIEPLINALEKALESDSDFEDDPNSCGAVVSTIANVLTDTYSIDLAKVPWKTDLAKEFARGWIDDYCYTCQKFVKADTLSSRTESLQIIKCPICETDIESRQSYFFNVLEIGGVNSVITWLKSLQMLPFSVKSKIGMSLDEIQAMHEGPLLDNGLQKCKYCANSKVNEDWGSSTFCDICFEKRETGQMGRFELALSDWDDKKLSKKLNELISSLRTDVSPLELLGSPNPVSMFFAEYQKELHQGSPAEQKVKKARFEAEAAASATEAVASAKKFRIGIEEVAKITALQEFMLKNY